MGRACNNVLSRGFELLEMFVGMFRLRNSSGLVIFSIRKRVVPSVISSS